MQLLQKHWFRKIYILLGLIAPGMVFTATAFAHTEGALTGSGFLIGFLHPFSGIDHVLAMLAVGMWGAQLKNPGIWALPVAFPMIMAFGGVAGLLGLPLPSIELGIALSVIVLGSMIALNLRPPLGVAVCLVGFFAIFHGYAHGAELPGQTGAVSYSMGFVSATGLIHLTGVAIGFVEKLPKGLQVLRTGGGAITVVGLYLGGKLFLF